MGRSEGTPPLTSWLGLAASTSSSPPRRRPERGARRPPQSCTHQPVRSMSSRQIKEKRYTARLRDNVAMSIEMAITDALTSLFNRRYMETHLAALTEQAAQRGKPLSVLILDIDFFKSINDGHGHDAGDDVLREFSLRIRKSIRNIDLACRYGGEEFVIVMPETDMAVAGMVAERIRRRIATEPFAVQQGTKSLEVTISIGIASLGSEGDTAAAMLKRADTALYRAKRDGRNRVVQDAAA